MNGRATENSVKSMSTKDAKQPNLYLFVVVPTLNLLQIKAKNNFKTFYDSSI
jgi:hypothetical protein